MNTNSPNSHPESWDKYWHGTGTTGAFSAGGVSHPAVQVFWGDFFQSVAKRYSPPRIVDIATGNGAVLQTALQVLGDESLAMTCVDISDAAIENAKQRFPTVTGIVSDATSIPLDDGSFDIVTSQFGVEYAGTDALTEAARLVAPGGALGFLMHIENGSVHKECQDSLAAIDALRETNFVALAIELFRNGFAAVKGADRTPYDAAGSQFAPAVAAAEKIMNDFGTDVAGGTIARLYEDVAQIHSRMPNYDPEEVLGWLGGMDAELLAYAKRMSSMISTVTSRTGIELVCKQLKHAGLKIGMANELLFADEELPLAWALIATRPE
jgi:SAM-dependent methyltransferase